MANVHFMGSKLGLHTEFFAAIDDLEREIRTDYVLPELAAKALDRVINIANEMMYQKFFDDADSKMLKNTLLKLSNAPVDVALKAYRAIKKLQTF